MSAETSLDRAKRFLAAKAAKLALTVVPLAALTVAAVPSHAGIISGLSYGSCSVTGTGASGSCTITQAAATGSDTNLNAIQLAGSADTTGGAISMGVSNAAGSGNYLGTVPVSWYFEILDPSLDTINWQMNVQISGNSGSTSISPNGSVSATGWITNNASLNLSTNPSNNITGYNLSITFTDVTHPTTGNFSVVIPAGSTIDLNTTTTAGPAPTAPEPATLLLTGGGLASLAVLRRRRKKT